MRGKLVAGTIATLALFLAAPASAQDRQSFVIVGPGSLDCARLVQIEKEFSDAGRLDEFETAIAAYAQGFWSGLNMQLQMSGQKDQLRALDFGSDAIPGAILGICRVDSATPLFSHLWQMFQRLKLVPAG